MVEKGDAYNGAERARCGTRAYLLLGK